MTVDKHANHFELAVRFMQHAIIEFGRDHHHSRVTVDLYIILSSHVHNLIPQSWNELNLNSSRNQDQYLHVQKFGST